MASLQSIQVGRQWCGLAAIPNSAGGAQKLKKTAQSVSGFRHQYPKTFMSLETGWDKQEKMQKTEGPKECTIKYRGNEIVVPRGEILRSALLKNGLTPHNGAAAKGLNCR
jgi:hypothetical protein